MELQNTKEAKTGVHAIRKMYATEAYLERINSGMGKEEAWGEVSEILGHGKDRMDLLEYMLRYERRSAHTFFCGSEDGFCIFKSSLI